MNTLLLRLNGAMQSWGVQSRFGVRDTGLEPSKSGVIGLLCAALGIPRHDDAALAELAALQMGVRVEREGKLQVDYHTAHQVLKAGGGLKKTELSNRYYLADAFFLVGLQSDTLALLERIHTALRNPTWPLFLGRKAFVPGEPIWLDDGLRPGMGLQEALDPHNTSYLGRPPVPARLRLVLDHPNGEQVRPDQPISFTMGSRRFAPRRVNVDFVDLPPIVSIANPRPTISNPEVP